MDNDQTDAPETEPGNDNDPMAEALLDVMMSRNSGGNSKPDTAQGVADLLEKTTEFVEERSRSQTGFFMSPDGSQVPMILKPDGDYEFVPLSTLDAYSPSPTFRRGKATMTSLNSFIAHVARFGDEDSAVFANDSRTAPTLTAVLDYHRKDTLRDEGEAAEGTRRHGEYRHGKHLTHFAFPLSDEWQAWHSGNARQMNMAEFAIFLENNVLDVAEVGNAIPESAERFVEMNGGKANIADWSKLTALAKSLAVYENAVVSEAINLASGEGQLTLSEDHETEIAGVKATVPTMFFIAIPIFREGAYYRLPVRLRYRKSGRSIVFWYELWRSDRAFTDAFHEAVNRVATETEAQVFFGAPEA